MTRQWKIVAGFAVLALSVPVVSLAAPTKQELLLKASENAKIDLLSKSAARDEARASRRAEAKKLHEQKMKLFMERKSMRHNRAAMDDNMQEIKNINKAMKQLGKGGTGR